LEGIDEGEVTLFKGQQMKATRLNAEAVYYMKKVNALSLFASKDFLIRAEDCLRVVQQRNQHKTRPPDDNGC
jgi:hypothetical protein